MLFVRLFNLCLFDFVGFLLVSGKNCDCGAPRTFLSPFWRFSRAYMFVCTGCLDVPELGTSCYIFLGIPDQPSIYQIANLIYYSSLPFSDLKDASWIDQIMSPIEPLKCFYQFCFLIPLAQQSCSEHFPTLHEVLII